MCCCDRTAWCTYSRSSPVTQPVRDAAAEGGDVHVRRRHSGRAVHAPSSSWRAQRLMSCRHVQVRHWLVEAIPHCLFYYLIFLCARTSLLTHRLFFIDYMCTFDLMHPESSTVRCQRFVIAAAGCMCTQVCAWLLLYVVLLLGSGLPAGFAHAWAIGFFYLDDWPLAALRWWCNGTRASIT